MKSSNSKRRVRTLRAKASTINPAEFEDYGPEPNMKLSHAFMVVLALHIIAVGGLFAFNKMKSSHAPFSLKSKAEHVLSKESVTSPSTSQDLAVTAVHSLSDTVSKVAKTIASHEQAQAPLAATTAADPTLRASAPLAPGTPSVTENPPSSSTPAAATPTLADATPGDLHEYTIVKGDNPYKVAKKFHVSYDALIKLNTITDPRKIQIGQKLKIPASSHVTSDTTTTAKNPQKKRLHH